MITLTQIIHGLFLRGGVFLSRTTSTNFLREFAQFLRPKVARGGLERLGASGDGGYLLPKTIRCQKLFSAGVDQSVSFELAYVERIPGAQVHLADGSIENLPQPIPNSTFAKSFLGHSGMDASEISMEAWLEQSDAGTEGNLLQMDIEGAEWHLFSETKKETWDKFDCIIMELHNLELVLNPVFFKERVSRMLKVLSEFDCVHLHVNNNGDVLRGSKISFPTLI